jgi:hypothetical protein
MRVNKKTPPAGGGLFALTIPAVNTTPSAMQRATTPRMQPSEMNKFTSAVTHSINRPLDHGC